MNLLRIVLIAIAVWIIISMIRRWREQKADERMAERETPRVGTMVQCQYCGMHVPEQEAVRDGDATYCTVEHQQASKQDE